MPDWDTHYQNDTLPWDRGASSPALHDWLAAGVLTPGRILIPGCGRGHEALDLARQGFQVTALDIAPTALEWLGDQLARAGVQAERVCADALSWRPEQPFQAIYEQTCLCALPPRDWPRYEASLHAWLRPGGELFALFMQTGKDGGPPFHCALDDMRSLFPDSRWRWPEGPGDRVPHPNLHHELALVLTRI